VLAFQACLGSVPRKERRVLELRAGVGSADTHSRAEVARLTGLRRSSVARLERRGLKRLRTLANGGTCAGATRVTPTTTATPTAAVGSTAPGANAGADQHSGILTVHKTHHSADSKASDDHQSAIEAAIERPVIQAMGHTLDLGPLLVAFALGGLLYFVVREVRRTA
jgi:hypothetical protein